MTSRYETPPVEEAIFELFVKDQPGWSELAYTRLSDAFAAEFDGETDILQPIGGFRVKIGPRGQFTHDGTDPGPKRLRHWNKDKTRLIQFGPNMSAFNVLKKSYTTFEDYVPTVTALTQAFLKEAQPTALDWVGQRYVNRIELPLGAADPAKFFTFYPLLPEPGSHRPFALQVLFETFPRGQVMLNLNFVGEQKSVPVYFLEIYARSVEPVPLDTIEVVQWQKDAHSAIRRAFEAVLTEESRKLFGGKT